MSLHDQFANSRKKLLTAARAQDARTRGILRTSIVGIIANAILVCVKLAIGNLTHSVAIVSDGLNNLADALSSVLVILATALAGKSPDRKHPYGYGRVVHRGLKSLQLTP